jgi:hypothetical protein
MRSIASSYGGLRANIHLSRPERLSRSTDLDRNLNTVALSAIYNPGTGMSIYKVRWFSRWARKQGLSDAALCEAVKEMAEGQYEADLGGNLLKKRIARPGQGKSGGFRTIVATNHDGRWFFVYGFAKNERSNIDDEEEAALKKLAKTLLTMAPTALGKAETAGEVTKVNCDA